VVLAPGYYQESLTFSGRNIILTSTDPNNKSVVQDTRLVGNGQRIAMSFKGSEDANFVIQGLTISDGANPQKGGAINGKGNRMTIRQCIISDGRAEIAGGGLYDCDGLIVDCTIKGNRVQEGGQGGGLYGCDGQIINCRIEDNWAEYRDNSGISGSGGGLAHCKATIEGCTIIENSAPEGQGGGLFECSGTILQCSISQNEAKYGAGLYGCTADISHCTISENTSSKDGAGMYDCSGLITDCLIKGNQSTGWHGGGVALCETLVNCIISDNMARGYGGGVYDCNMLMNCMISNNVAEVYPGGGLYKARSVINSLIVGNQSGDEGGACCDVNEISGCTIVGNYATNQGGGLVYRNGAGRVDNTIVWDNVSQEPGPQIVAAWDCNDPIEIQYSTIQGGLEAVATEDNCAVNWLAGNLEADPQFEDTGYRSGSGTWHAGDYHLLDTSPCINAGDPKFVGTDQNDVEGRIRVVDGIVDMGAYEYEFVPVLLQNIVVTGPERVTYGQSVQYTAMAYYDNRSVADVTSQAAWSVKPQEVAVVEIGELSLLPLDDPVQFTVSATYAEGDLIRDSNLVVLGLPVPVPEPEPNPVTPGTYHVDTLTGDNGNRGLSRAEALATIQVAIDRATDGDVILVWPGVYREAIRFKGKAVTVQSADDAAVLENPEGLAVSFILSEGPDSVLKNFVIRSSVSGVLVAASSPTLANLTVVGNERGIECYAGLPTVTHCIFWENTELDVLGCSPQYSWLQAGRGPRRVVMPVQDPGFVNPYRGDYHLRSEAGHWDSTLKTWVADRTTSPCIDAGNWYSAVGPEPFPNGGIVNQGAYGGTAYASWSYFGEPVCPVMMAGDINGDCTVDEWDMELLLLHWLEEFHEEIDIDTGPNR